MINSVLLFIVDVGTGGGNSYPLEKNDFDPTTSEYESDSSTTQPTILDSVIELQDLWRLTALKDEISLVDSNQGKNQVGISGAKSFYVSLLFVQNYPSDPNYSHYVL